MFEETLVCDGCCRVIDGGSREQTLRTLRDQGGRAFFRLGLDNNALREASPDEPWGGTRRHLGGCCATLTKFYDADDVPAPVLGELLPGVSGQENALAREDDRHA